MNRVSLATVHTHTHTHTLLLNKVDGLFDESENLNLLNNVKIKVNKLA